MEVDGFLRTVLLWALFIPTAHSRQYQGELSSEFL